MSRTDPRPQRALNIAALAVLAVLGAWIAWSQAMRRAERRAQEARQLERQEQERQRKAARPRLPARPLGADEPEKGDAHGPVACLKAVDLGDGTLPSQWGVAATSPASANAMPHAADSNTIRFTLGDNRFALRRQAVGVKVSVKWEAVDPMWEGNATDVLVRLTSGGRPLGENKATGGVLPTKLAITDYGGSADIWGTGAAIPADVVNAADFGVDIAVNADSPMCSVRIASVEITVYESRDAELR
jgi:hypothetical protein